MKTTDMDADLVQITDPEKLSFRLGYWETRLRLSRPSVETINDFEEVAKKHALRVANVVRAG